METLSVSSSTSGSSVAIVSPTDFIQRAMVASVTDSPSVGTRISVAMSFFSVAFYSPSASSRKSLELRQMLRHKAGCGRCRGRTAGVAHARVLGLDVLQNPFQIRVDEGPGTHVLGLFLAPHHLRIS